MFLEQALDNAQAKKYKWEWYTMIVADAKTGAVLGAVSNPSFDPNKRNISNYLDYTTGVAFEPGSTMKTWTYMAVMENSKYNGNAKYKSGTYTASSFTNESSRFDNAASSRPARVPVTVTRSTASIVISK